MNECVGGLKYTRVSLESLAVPLHKITAADGMNEVHLYGNYCFGSRLSLVFGTVESWWRNAPIWK